MGHGPAMQGTMPPVDASPVVAADLLAAVAGLALGAYAWRRRGSPGAAPLAAVGLGVAVWTGADAISILLPGRAGSVFWFHVVQVGVVTTVTAWALFALEYAGLGEHLGHRVYAALAVEPVLALALAFTNPSHGLFWPSYRFDATAGTAVPVLGPAGWAHVAYGYSVMLVSGGVLAATLLRRDDAPDRGRLLALVGALVVPVTAHAVRLAVRRPDPTAVGFLLAGGLLAVTTVDRRRAAVTPVARAAIVERLRAGVVVLDGDRVVDHNPSAKRLLGLPDDVVGRTATEAFEPAPAVAEWYRTGADGDAEIDVDTTDGTRTLDVDVTSLAGTGTIRLVQFYDVTERRRRRETLREQSARLERFAAVAAHEFRNPLAIARGNVETAIEDPDDADLHAAERALDRMALTVDEVLDIAREGRAIVDTTPVTLVSAAESAWADVDAGRAVLQPVTTAPVSADRIRLQRLLGNLFRNCIERTRQTARNGAADGAVTARPGPGGTCEDPSPVTITVGLLRATPEGEMVPDGDGRPGGFYVADDGVTIPEADRRRLLEAGYDGDYADLGLSVVRTIARAHGWSLRITASGEGGTRFEIGEVEFVDDGSA